MAHLIRCCCRVAFGLVLLLSISGSVRADTTADLNEARSLSSSAAASFQAGKLAEAQRLARRALDLRVRALPEGHPDVAQSLYDLGYYLQALGELVEADALLTRALNMRESASPPRPQELAQSLSGLGVLRQVQGRLTDAEPLYKRALELREKSLPPGHAQIATSLNNLAYLYQILGRTGEAEPLQKRALAIWEKALPPGHPQLAWSLVNLGILLLEQGRADEAEPLQRRALEIREKALPAGHPDIAKSLSLIGTILQRKRQLREAETAHRRALAILEKALPPEHADIAISYNNLAIVYDSEGRLDEAEAAYRRALQIREKALPPGHPDIATNLSNLAIVYRRQSRYADAERLLMRALELLERNLPAGHPSVATALSTLSTVAMAQRNWHAAMAYELRATDMAMARERRARQGTDGVTDLTTGSGSAELRGRAHDFYGLVKVAHRVASAEPSRKSELLETTFSRAQWAGTSQAAGSLSQMAARTAKNDPRLSQLVRQRQDLVAEWKVQDQALLTLATLPPERRTSGADQRLHQRIESIDRELAAIDRTLKSEFAEYFALANSEPASVAETQRVIDENEALVFILDTEHVSADLPEETFVWVVTKTAARWTRSEIGGKHLRESVLALRCGLDASLWHAEELAKKCRELLADLPQAPVLPFDTSRAHKLYKTLLDGAEDLIRGKHLLVVPSGALTTLPFQVLVTRLPASADVSAASWLVRDHAITVLPSVSSLVALRRTGKPSAAPKPMIGFGNPLLDGNQAHPRHGAYFREQAAMARAHTGCARSSVQRTASLRGVSRSLDTAPLATGSIADLDHLRIQAPLPETADELCAVVRSVGGSVDDVWIGARATETEVKRLSSSGELAKYRFVHFATHGTLSGQLRGTTDPGLILTPPGTATSNDDGFLSGGEIASLKLDADWVILSACNTAAGAGQGEAAEALSGLARVFFYAGARALLVTHWEVDSDAAVKIVTTAIGALTKDKSQGRAEALRRAILTLMADTSRPKSWVPATHPAVWAPFVVVGEGSPGR